MIDPQEIEKIFRECKELNHVPIPYEDLVECIIGIDIREKYPEIADKWTGMMSTWLTYGYSEQEVVDIFYALMISVYVDAKIDTVFDDIQKYLESQ